MNLNVQRLRDLVAANPGIRTVQLSDKLDWDFDALEEVLDTEVRCQRIIAYQVMAPNNRKATAYRMAGTPEPQQAPASAPTPAPAAANVQAKPTGPAPLPAPTRPAPPMPAVKPAKTDESQPAVAAAPPKGLPMSSSTYTPRPGSKVALAVAALLDGPLNCQQLAKAMESVPANIHALLSAARAYKLIGIAKDETGVAHFYLVGMPLDERFKPVPSSQDGKDPAAGATPKAVKKPTATPKSALTGIHVPQFKKASPVAPKGAAVAPQSQQDFVAGLMSNGELIIHGGGESITLSADHTNQLFTYLDKARAQYE